MIEAKKRKEYKKERTIGIANVSFYVACMRNHNSHFPSIRPLVRSSNFTFFTFSAFIALLLPINMLSLFYQCPFTRDLSVGPYVGPLRIEC